MIPTEVIDSEACRSLGYAARWIMVIVAAQCWPKGDRYEGRNGTAAFTGTFAKAHGFNGRDTIYRALADLTDRGLLVRTRDGMRIRNIFTLYAVGWLPITHIEGKQVTPAKPAPNHWRSWTPTPPPKGPNAGKGAKKFVTDSRERTVPEIGNDRQEYGPKIGNSGANYGPKIGHTSRFSPAPSQQSTSDAPPTGTPGHGRRGGDLHGFSDLP
jgi:hypothetical protein